MFSKSKKLIKTEESKLINVVIPVFNSSKFIKRLLHQLDQLDSNFFDILLIDDGSVDNTVEIIKEQIQGKTNFRLIKIKHSGVSAARNIGLKNSYSKFIWFIDADDEIFSESANSLINTIPKNVDVITFPHKQSGTANTVVGWFNSSNHPCSNFFECVKDDPYCWDKVYSTDFLLKNKIKFKKNISVGEDALFNFYVMRKSPIIFSTKCCLYQYNNLNNFSVMKITNQNIVIKNHFKLIKNILKKLNKNDLTNKKLIHDYFVLLITNRISEQNIIKKNMHRLKLIYIIYNWRFYES